MAPRANWKGYLKLSLVSCAVALYPAAKSSARVAFHTLNRATGHRLRRQMFDPETGDVVETEDQVKGYEVAKGEYVMVEDEEIDAIAIESTHTIDIERFVPRSEIDELYLDAPYYLAPEDRVAEEAFAVIREAMRKTGMVGLARLVLYRRERIVMLEPRGKGLFAAILRYPYEVREDKPYFEEIPDVTIPPEMLDLAQHIISKMEGHFEPETFEDRYENAMIELVKAKQSGREAALPAPAARPSNVVNLMDALRRSVQADAGEPAPSSSSRAKPPAPAKSSKRGAAPSASKSANSAARSKKPAAAPASSSKSRTGKPAAPAGKGAAAKSAAAKSAPQRGGRLRKVG
ncbi:Ku protein [Alsobacter sp. SYSU M60028]|uniref:Non-homologous end joining protein Ku n=1 Tax=Alsobacter ponti TaxID=2962936 RepID=A0ABT1L739_9HYPH|nr:Ku protein [Alsobacter ponti]MCP8937260.1 Ku protein [Alsobacter ponti]